MTIKTYSSKSNAKRAAVAAGLDMSVAVLVEVEGGFVYQAPAVEVDDGSSVSHYSVHGLLECPSCKCHLSNGVMDFDSLVDSMGSAKKAWAEQAKEYACMGCGFEFGDDIDEPGTKAKAVSTGTGIKIQKERVEANGVVRPSVGGVCDKVWLHCDALAAVDNMVPAVKDIKAWAAAEGVDNTTATIQYYAWRKHMGVVGRAKEMPAK